MTGDVRADTVRVEWWRRALVLAAAAAAAAATAFVVAYLTPAALIVYGPWGGLALVPLLARSRSSFRRVSLIVGCCLCIVGVVLVIIGFFAYIPSGLALLLAASVRRARASAVASLLISLCALGWWTGRTIQEIHRSGEYDVFVVQFDGQEYRNHEDALRLTSLSPAPFGRGASSVSVGAGPDGPRWSVSFPEELPAEDRARLREYLSERPAVLSVTECDEQPACVR